VGSVDGTFITLRCSSLTDWYTYFNRKFTYALNAMVVCDDKRRIINIRVNDTSTVHDARVFEISEPSKVPEEFFLQMRGTY
jgi:hypothetical protein